MIPEWHAHLESIGGQLELECHMILGSHVRVSPCTRHPMSRLSLLMSKRGCVHGALLVNSWHLRSPVQAKPLLETASFYPSCLFRGLKHHLYLSLQCTTCHWSQQGLHVSGDETNRRVDCHCKRTWRTVMKNLDPRSRYLEIFGPPVQIFWASGPDISKKICTPMELKLDEIFRLPMKFLPPPPLTKGK